MRPASWRCGAAVAFVFALFTFAYASAIDYIEPSSRPSFNLVNLYQIPKRSVLARLARCQTTLRDGSAQYRK